MERIASTMPCHTQNGPKQIVWFPGKFLSFFFYNQLTFHSVFRFYFCNNDITAPEMATMPERMTSLSTRTQPHKPLLMGWIAGVTMMDGEARG
jgi:hypothetical protein